MIKHSLPEWVGYILLFLSLILIFPAFSIMLESNDPDIWKLKIERLGVLYTVGSLFWAFLTWVIIIIMLYLGINDIRNHDKSTTI